VVRPYSPQPAVPVGSAVSCGGTVQIAIVPVLGLQNGAPDGIALIGPGSTVVQFLSYEGAFTAVGGPANGVLSTDILVVESNATTPGFSLQLSGNGAAYADFAWQAPADDTFGACNNGQTFGAAPDVAPTVTTTTPANGASGVGIASNVTINFSEPVSATGAWYSISCPTSGTHAATQTGGPQSYVLDPTTDFAFSETCTVTIVATQVTDLDGTADPMAANYAFTFTTGADNAPTVASTVPVDNATGVAPASDVTITFSEPVTATGTWYTFLCGGNPQATTASGGPLTFTIDPTGSLPSGTNCVVTVLATQVADQDGAATQLAADYVFDFTTAVDSAPVVASTLPTAGSSSVATTANVVVNFSEPVNVSGAWYAIACTTSAAHTAVVTGGPTSYTLNPDADFANSESCTVTIEADLVVDTDGTPTNMAADYPFTFGTAATAGDYYAGIDASNATTLRTGLHNRIKDHIAFTYFGAWTVLETADQDPLNSARILDVYRNKTYTKVDCRSGAASSCPAGAANRYNREHTWPNSHGFNDLSGLDGNGNPYSPYTDTHMLYLSAEDYNSNRGNKPYGNCSGCSEDPTQLYNGFGGGTGVYPGNSNWDGASVYEAWNHRKGDLARAVLYMDVRYEGGNAANGQPEPDLIVTDNAGLIGTTPSGQVPPFGYMGLKSVLVQWNSQDPPDDQERLRNDVIYSFQQNRNPFIDHPEWVDCLFATPSVCNGAPPDALFANGFE
jgi:endonuclease I/methionine-rich copper-binding protein CopC